MATTADSDPARTQRQVLFGLGALAVAGFGAWAAHTARGRTPPVTDGDGAPLSNSIAVERGVTLGGVKQYLLLRGRDKTAPLLLNVHGGPGMSERAFYRFHNAALEDHFVVAYWDQRGAGKSFDRKLDRATLTIDRISADQMELVDLLLAVFGRSQVLLLAHSWGTLISLEHIARRPGRLMSFWKSAICFFGSTGFTPIRRHKVHSVDRSGLFADDFRMSFDGSFRASRLPPWNALCRRPTSPLSP